MDWGIARGKDFGEGGRFLFVVVVFIFLFSSLGVILFSLV